jgi:hypothetical protein
MFEGESSSIVIYILVIFNLKTLATWWYLNFIIRMVDGANQYTR